MLQQDRSISAKKQGRTVQCPAFLLDDADFKIHMMRPRRFRDGLDLGGRNSYS